MKKIIIFLVFTTQINFAQNIFPTSGNVGIGVLSPSSSLSVRTTPGPNDAHIFFGEYSAISGQPSAILCFGGTGLLNSGFTWVPNSNMNNGKLYLSFGGYENGIKNAIKMTFQSNGNVGIGSLNPQNKLDVNGTIHSQEVKVDMLGWSDFVFKKEYSLPTLEQVEKHINEKGHLENIPSEEEVLKNGINLGKMNVKLLQKIEELTLYMIDQEKKNNKQSEEINFLKKENRYFQSLLERIEKLENQFK